MINTQDDSDSLSLGPRLKDKRYQLSQPRLLFLVADSTSSESSSSFYVHLYSLFTNIRIYFSVHLYTKIIHTHTATRGVASLFCVKNVDKLKYSLMRGRVLSIVGVSGPVLDLTSFMTY